MTTGIDFSIFSSRDDAVVYNLVADFQRKIQVIYNAFIAEKKYFECLTKFLLHKGTNLGCIHSDVFTIPNKRIALYSLIDKWDYIVNINLTSNCDRPILNKED